MLTPWLDLPDARATVQRWSERSGLDLLELGTTASAEQVRATEVAQPLLTAVALLSGRAVLAGRTPSAVCGHSIGELSALALAGVLTDDEAVSLAAGRGRLMAEAAVLRPTGMAALLGGGPVEQSDVVAAGLQVATVNVAGQVVVGGPVEAIEAWTPPSGARVRRLDVAGAFHTEAMAPAVPGLRALVDALSPRDADCDVVANADGARLRDGRELVDRLVAQLTRPVRFDLCLAAVADATRGVELAPAGVLTGLAKRALPDLPVTPLRGADDLAALDPVVVDLTAAEQGVSA